MRRVCFLALWMLEATEKRREPNFLQSESLNLILNESNGPTLLLQENNKEKCVSAGVESVVLSLRVTMEVGEGRGGRLQSEDLVKKW